MSIPSRIHVIYNGIDLAEYQKTSETKALTDYGVDPAVPYVLFVGRITRQKGVTHLVDAIRLPAAGDAGGAVRGRSRHAGDCDELREKVRRRRAKDHPRIVWIEKMVTKQETIQLYSHAACSAARRFMSRSGSSISRRWRAVLRWWPARRAASKR